LFLKRKCNLEEVIGEAVHHERFGDIIDKYCEHELPGIRTKRRILPIQQKTKWMEDNA
jgi:hypothetical protein